MHGLRLDGAMTPLPRRPLPAGLTRLSGEEASAGPRQHTCPLRLRQHHWPVEFNRGPALSHWPGLAGQRQRPLDNLELVATASGESALLADPRAVAAEEKGR